jgi:hypothetical protein
LITEAGALMSPIVLAIAVALAGMAVTAAWFGISRRRKEEALIGVQALASMKWRDSIVLVMEALQREGYERDRDEPEEAGANEFMLRQAGKPVLLGYKHGTAYRLTDANLREFAAAAHMRGAKAGVLVTLGSAEPAAHTTAATAGVQLIDGAHLWPKLRPLVPPELLDRVHGDAVGRTSKGLWTGAVVSLLLGVGVFVGAGLFGEPAAPPAAEVPVVALAPAGTAAGSAGAARGSADSTVRQDEDMLRELRENARAMEEVGKLTPAQLAARRAETAREIGLLAQVDTANWSGPRTLLIRMVRTDGKDKSLVDEACRLVIRHEELRYTRLQLEPPQDSTQAVRWRLCE